MAIISTLINTGGPIKSSVPLVERRFGQGLGFSAQTKVGESAKDSKEILVELSRSAKRYSNANVSSQPSQKVSASSSPLNQAIDAISEIADKINSLQDKYSKAAAGSELSDSLSSELGALAQEYKRITTSNIFKSASSGGELNAEGDNLGSLGLSDASVKAVLDSGNETRIDALTKGLQGLSSLNVDDILNDKNIAKGIKDFVAAIKSALEPTKEEVQKTGGEESKDNLVSVLAPQASIKTIGAAEGLGVSLLSYSNEDLIKAAAAHVDINATNVLILTYNAPELEESEEEKKKREEEQEQEIQIENPTKSATGRINTAEG